MGNVFNDIDSAVERMTAAEKALKISKLLAQRAKLLLEGASVPALDFKVYDTTGEEVSLDEIDRVLPDVDEAEEESDAPKDETETMEAMKVAHEAAYRQRLKAYSFPSPLPASYLRSYEGLCRQAVRSQVVRHPGWIDYRRNALSGRNSAEMCDSEIYKAAHTLGINVPQIRTDMMRLLGEERRRTRAA